MSTTDEPVRDALKRSALLGFSITALIPTLIATWTAAAATLASTGLLRLTPKLALLFAMAACAGIVVWFWLLVSGVRRYKDRFRPETLGKIVRVIGVALIGLGLWFAWLLLRSLLAA